VELNQNVLVDYRDGVVEYTEDALNAIRAVGEP
jgi:hypothetical protein